MRKDPGIGCLVHSEGSGLQCACLRHTSGILGQAHQYKESEYVGLVSCTLQRLPCKLRTRHFFMLRGLYANEQLQELLGLYEVLLIPSCVEYPGRARLPTIRMSQSQQGAGAAAASTSLQDLPDPIIFHMTSYLPHPDLVQLSMLSRWVSKRRKARLMQSKRSGSQIVTVRTLVLTIQTRPSVNTSRPMVNIYCLISVIGSKSKSVKEVWH